MVSRKTEMLGCVDDVQNRRDADGFDHWRCTSTTVAAAAGNVCSQARREGEVESFPWLRDVCGAQLSLKNTKKGVTDTRWLLSDLMYA